MTESNRVYKEFQRLYQLRPELNIRANDKFFLDYARDMGGTEMFTAESAILWLDDPALRGQLAVLRETPAEEISRWMRENPAYDNVANRQMIAQRMRNYESVEQAVSVLAGQLAFNHEVHEEHLANKEAEERISLIEEIALDRSRDKTAQEITRNKLQLQPTEFLRSKANEIRERGRYSRMTPDQLRAHLDQLREQTAPAAAQLPENVTREYIIKLPPASIRALVKRYGEDLVNARIREA